MERWPPCLAVWRSSPVTFPRAAPPPSIRWWRCGLNEYPGGRSLARRRRATWIDDQVLETKTRRELELARGLRVEDLAERRVRRGVRAVGPVHGRGNQLVRQVEA